MRAINKVFFAEFKKLLFNKRLLILSAVLILSVYGLTAALYFSKPSYDPKQNVQSRERQLAFYQARLEELKTDAPTGTVYIDAQKKIKEYEYYISTQTIESDYLDASNKTAKIKGGEGTGFMFYLYNVFCYPLMVFSVLAVICVFVTEYNFNTVKNLLAAPVKRRDVFLGKQTFALVIIFSLFLLLFLPMFALGGGAKFLVYTQDGRYVAASAVSVFAMKCFRLFILMLTFSSVATAAGIFSRKAIFSGILTVAVYALILAIYLMISFSAESDGKIELANKIQYYFPFISMQTYDDILDLRLYVMAFLHVVLSALLSLLAVIRFKKQNI